MALFVNVLRSRRFYTRRQAGSFPPVVKLDFSITGSGGVVLGGSGLVGGATPSGTGLKDGGVRVMTGRREVRVW